MVVSGKFSRPTLGTEHTHTHSVRAGMCLSENVFRRKAANVRNSRRHTHTDHT